jgi:hypothetical protein
VELFVIQCTTCHARLKVHDPAVIGQIVECPKCNSFVAVTAPPNWQSPTGASTAGGPSTTGASDNPPATSGGTSRTAVSKPAVAAAAPTAANPRPARNSAPPPLPKKADGGSAGLSRSSAPLQGAGAQSAGRSPATGPWAPSPARPAPVLANAAGGDSTEIVGARKRAASIALALLGPQRWWLLGGAAAVLAVVSVAWVATRAHQPAAEPNVPAVVEPSTEPTAANSLGLDPAATTQAGALPTEAAPSNVASGATTESTPAADPPSGASEGTDQPGGTSPLSTGKTSGTDLVTKTIAPTGDPLGSVQPGTPAVGSSEGITGTDGLPPESTTAAEEEPAEGEPFDPVKQAQLMSHMQDKLPALEFTGVPLVQFVAFLTEFSTVPMTIDSASLTEIGKSAKTRISVKLDDATVEQALKAALEKPGLAFHIKPGRLVITARSAKSK